MTTTAASHADGPPIGRDATLRNIDRALATARVVTLTGPPGVGKTHLAEHVTTQSDDAGEITLLSAASTDADVVAAIAQALGTTGSLDTVDPVDALVASAATRGVRLVVLDNAEHVWQYVADLVSAWIERDPDVRFLVTSQRPLRLRAERVIRVDPLDPEAAMELFFRRCGLEDDPELRPDVEILVRGLDCLPLAIELAAGRASLMGPADIAARFDRRLQLLRDRDADGRHRSLEAAIDWAWSTLEPAERDVLTSLCAFRGGFDVDAFEAIVGFDSLETLEELVDRSLVVVDERSAARRFDLLESIRVFVETRVDEIEFERHSEYYAELAEAAARQLGGPEHTWALEILSTEQSNARRVIDRAKPTLAVRTALALGSLYLEVGPAVAAQRVIAAARERLAYLDDVVASARVAFGEGRFCINMREFDDALERLGCAIGEAERAGDTETEVLALRMTAGIHCARGQIDEARALYAKAMERAAEDERLRALVEIYFLYNVAARFDDPSETADRLTEAIGTLERHDETLEALHAMSLLGTTLFEADRAAEALVLLDEAERKARDSGLTLVLVSLLTMRADYLRTEGSADQALELLREAQQLAISTGNATWRDQVDREIVGALIDIEELEAAEKLARRQLPRMRSTGSDMLQAALLCDLAAIAHERRQLDTAQELYAQARQLRSDAIAERIAFGEALIALERGDAETGEELLRSVDNAEARAGKVLTGQLEPGVSWAERMAARVRRADVRTTLHVGPQSRWLRLPDGDVVDLARRGPPRMILDQLVEAHIASTGEAYSVDELVDVGWPGQDEVDLETRRRRAYVAIQALRKLGLRDILRTRADGYVLDPDIEVVRSRAAAPPEAED